MIIDDFATYLSTATWTNMINPPTIFKTSESVFKGSNQINLSDDTLNNLSESNDGSLGFWKNNIKLLMRVSNATDAKKALDDLVTIVNAYKGNNRQVIISNIDRDKNPTEKIYTLTLYITIIQAKAAGSW